MASEACPAGCAGRREGEPFLETRVRKLFIFIGATVGSYAGWALGAHAGIMTAYMLSMLGTGVGMYAGHRTAKQLEV
jgi:uncharacterized membrane protein SpoIIM required for sporulation